MLRAVHTAGHFAAGPDAEPAVPQPLSPPEPQHKADPPERSEGKSVAAVMERSPSPSKPKPKTLPPYHVVLLDDDDHTYQYVTQMLRSVFGYAPSRGMKIAREVDTHGRAIVLTTHKELAELKRDLIMGFGADPQLSSSTGSMRAVIEPAPQ